MKIDYFKQPEILNISGETILNLLSIDIKKDEIVIPLVYDTGGTMTTISKSTAILLKAEMTDELTKGGGNAGNTISGNIAIVDYINIGHTVIQNFKVQVVPDKVLEFDLNGDGKTTKVNGLLGWDIIQHFKWHFNAVEKNFGIEKPILRKNNKFANMDDWDNMPIIHVNIQDEDEAFGFDSGNTESKIGSRLFDSFTQAKEITDTIVGVDGVSEETVRIINRFTFKLGEEEIELKDISAINRMIFPTKNKKICGLLAIDIVEGKSWTLDYQNRVFKVINESEE